MTRQPLAERRQGQLFVRPDHARPGTARQRAQKPQAGAGPEPSRDETMTLAQHEIGRRQARATPLEVAPDGEGPAVGLVALVQQRDPSRRVYEDLERDRRLRFSRSWARYSSCRSARSAGASLACSDPINAWNAA